jgi:succinate dehydrogenase/fumarate reductase flavoprotein subunit
MIVSSESLVVDVVVVGGGGTGLAAAVEAATRGARVLLLEKNPELGGTTAWSIGSISATRTRLQRSAGIEDSPESHYRDMALFHKDKRPDNEALRRILTDNVPDTIQWLMDLGVEFFGPLDEPPHTKPRMHNVLPNSRAYIYHLARAARRVGVDIMTSARVERLITRDGVVTGVAFGHEGRVKTVEAARGVILASGDYAGSREMKAAYISESMAMTEAINPTSTGDGQRMAMTLGGTLRNTDMFLGGVRFLPPAKRSWISRLPPSRWLMRPTSLALRYVPHGIIRKFLMGFLTTVLVPSHKLFEAGAILINRNGERFTDETKKMVYELPFQPDGMGYIVFDSRLAEKHSKPPYYVSTAPGFAYAFLADYERNRPDLFHRAGSPEELAAGLGIHPAKLRASLDQYNQGGSGGDAKATPRGDRPALDAGPYYALGPVKNYVNFTDGGLVISERFEVLRDDGSVITGLYAAGSAGQGGLLLNGHGHHLGWAFTSGRLSGRHVAGLPPRTPAAS